MHARPRAQHTYHRHEDGAHAEEMGGLDEGGVGGHGDDHLEGFRGLRVQFLVSVPVCVCGLFLWGVGCVYIFIFIFMCVYMHTYSCVGGLLYVGGRKDRSGLPKGAKKKRHSIRPPHVSPHPHI